MQVRHGYDKVSLCISLLQLRDMETDMGTLKQATTDLSTEVCHGFEYLRAAYTCEILVRHAITL